MKLINIVLVIFISTFSISSSLADEGLWIPKLIKAQEAKMKSLGLEISAEEIYSEEFNSLKDVIIHFGGGCTGSIISDQGLILTNHHCGYSQIQSHSSLEHNYLKNGFWAESFDQELPNNGLTATFIKSMKNVTNEVLEGIEVKMSDKENAEIIATNIKRIGESAIEGTGYTYQVRPFYEGNQYYLILSQTFYDIRLVGAPPSSIGKFGFDTDNWVWPRHTGDFSLFRIYANEENMPANYSVDNIPYKAPRSAEISINGIKEGDFTLVFGFPGTTNEYLYSKELDFQINEYMPLAIEMREYSLSVIDREMRKSEQVSIQYAAKQNRISNYYKKMIGQSKGLRKIDAVGKKRELENKFRAAVSKDKRFKELYGDVLNEYDLVLKDYKPLSIGYLLFRELVYYGPEFIRFVNGIENQLNSELSIEEKKENIELRFNSFYKNYDSDIDRELLLGMSEIFVSNIKEEYLDDQLRQNLQNKEYSKLANELFDNSIFTDQIRAREWLNSLNEENLSIKNDPASVFILGVYKTYIDNIQNQFIEVSKNLDRLNKRYMMAQMKVLPEEKNYYPDANSTLRVSYGSVKGYSPRDGIHYDYFTSAEGILEKYQPDSYEFNLPEKLISLIDEKNFGDYQQDGKLPVCFLSNTHTSNGSSGSPAFNSKGQLIGINFDRTWEATISDMMYDSEICRNIMVDTRYILFIVDKFAGAQRLIDEMKIVK